MKDENDIRQMMKQSCNLIGKVWSLLPAGEVSIKYQVTLKQIEERLEQPKQVRISDAASIVGIARTTTSHIRDTFGPENVKIIEEQSKLADAHSSLHEGIRQLKRAPYRYGLAEYDRLVAQKEEEARKGLFVDVMARALRQWRRDTSQQNVR